MPPSQRGGLCGTNVTDDSLDSFANVVSSSDAIQLLRNIQRQALQYSIEILTSPLFVSSLELLLDGEEVDDIMRIGWPTATGFCNRVDEVSIGLNEVRRIVLRFERVSVVFGEQTNASDEGNEYA